MLLGFLGACKNFCDLNFVQPHCAVAVLVSDMVLSIERGEDTLRCHVVSRRVGTPEPTVRLYPKAQFSKVKSGAPLPATYRTGSLKTFAAFDCSRSSFVVDVLAANA